VIAVPLVAICGPIQRLHAHLQTLDRYGATNEAKKQALFAQAAQVDKLRPIATELGCSLANLSLAWVISNPDVSTAIFGASSVQQVHDNLKAIEVRDKLYEPSSSLTRTRCVLLQPHTIRICPWRVYTLQRTVATCPRDLVCTGVLR
jgi:predicted aldo/keto reductase-like oxidoreductase